MRIIKTEDKGRVIIEARGMIITIDPERLVIQQDDRTLVIDVDGLKIVESK